jgi:hypothetical protein
MTPEDLLARARDVGGTADIVEAIDDYELQGRRGWDLTGWRYEMVPWGVRFLYDGKGGEASEVLVLASLAADMPVAAEANRRMGRRVVLAGP